MARERAADHLPRVVLERSDFAKACADRDLGEVLRIAKQWGGVGFTASHLARRCELTVSRVQDYISGRVRAQRVEVFERVADGLHIPGGMFDLAARPWEEAVAASQVALKGTDEAQRDGRTSVQRRDFVKLSAGLAAGTLAGGMSADRPQLLRQRIRSRTVKTLRTNLTRLRGLDDHLGGADTYRLYLAEFNKAEGLLKRGSFTGETRREMLTFCAEVAQQAGWAAFDAGWQRDAQQLYDRSVTAAKEAGDQALCGNALALRSYQLLSTGMVKTELTDRSCAIAVTSAQPAVQSLLHQRGALIYAAAGDVNKTARALGSAEEALTAADSGPEPEWAVWAHSPTEWRIVAGRCWAELHRPLRAVPLLEAAMSEYDNSHARDKALYLTWLADSYLDADELEHAMAVTSHALDLAGGVASARPHERIGAVLDRFEAHESVPGVAELIARRPVNPVQVRS